MQDYVGITWNSEVNVIAGCWHPILSKLSVQGTELWPAAKETFPASLSALELC